MARSKPTITYKKKDEIAVISMNRPEYNNAQNGKMTYDLDKAFKRAKLLAKLRKRLGRTLSVLVIANNGFNILTQPFFISCSFYFFPSLSLNEVVFPWLLSFHS